MRPSDKRTLTVSLKTSEAEISRLEKAAELLWPGALLSRSTIIRSLANMAADLALKKKRPKKK